MLFRFLLLLLREKRGENIAITFKYVISMKEEKLNTKH